LTQAAMSDEVEEMGDVNLSGRHRQHVTFLVDDRSYGIDIAQVREIKQWSPITALPNQTRHMLGVLNLRGTVIPVHDLRARFGGQLTTTSENHVVLIAWVGEQTVGILVDAVSDIISVDSEEIRPLPSTTQGVPQTSAISGLVPNADDMVALIELERLFEDFEEVSEKQNSTPVA